MSTPAALRGLLARLDRPAAMRIAAIASLVSNIAIVVTGGAVRLTKSGLGCPTWPRCTSDSLVPTAAQADHGQIEFANRMLTWVLVIVAFAALAIAVRQRRSPGGRRRWQLALAIFLGIPAQAVLGGLTVLTDLNPWLVGGHLLLSMVLIAIATALLHATPPSESAPAVALTRTTASSGRAAGPIDAIRNALGVLTVAAAGVTLVLGVVVTGSGPHAGATTEEGLARRINFDPQQVTQLHADAVMVLVGLTIALAVLARFASPTAAWARAVWILLGLEVAQGAIGFIQYFAGVPPLLVGLHMLGASLVWACAVWVLLVGRDASDQASAGQHRDGMDRDADQRPDDRAVDADELQVSAHL